MTDSASPDSAISILEKQSQKLKSKEPAEVWRSKLREKQLPPDGNWFVWIYRGGRGSGKSLSGAHWTHMRAMKSPRYVALVGKTPQEVDAIMLNGAGGLLTWAPASEKPKFNPSKRRLVWPNGSIGIIYTSEEPDGPRGFSGDTAWVDEFAKYHERNAETLWNNLLFGLREASEDRPRICITTTGRDMAPYKAVEKRKDAVVVVGSSYENKENLSENFVDEVLNSMEGSRLAEQEIHGGIVESAGGALWRMEDIEQYRIHDGVIPWDEIARVVVGVDPMTGEPNRKRTEEEGAETGIVVAGLAKQRDVRNRARFYILDDRSASGSPRVWAQEVSRAAEAYGASRIVAEKNQGGEMVQNIIQDANDRIPIRMVQASHGKMARAEPIAHLYDQGRVMHVGTYEKLESQMTSYDGTGPSPDRLDALCWALTDLSRRRKAGGWGKT